MVAYPSEPNVIPLPSRSVSLALVVSDPDCVTELEKRSEGHARTGFALDALRVGVLAMRCASGTVDAHSIRREHERMEAQMREMLAERGREMTEAMGQTLVSYLDPKSGSFPQRIEELTKQGGDLERLLSRHVGGDDSVLARTIARHVGEASPIFRLLSPEQADGVVGSLTKTVEKALREQRETILAQFSYPTEQDDTSKRLLMMGHSSTSRAARFCRETPKTGVANWPKGQPMGQGEAPHACGRSTADGREDAPRCSGVSDAQR